MENAPVKNKKRRYLLPREEKRKGLYTSLPVYGKILHILWKYRFCTIDHIATFLACETTGTLQSPSYQSIQHALSALWHNGYIVKRPLMSRSAVRSGTEKDVWCLGSHGASFLAEQHGFFVDEIKYPLLPQTSKAHGGIPENEYQNLKHNLLITDTLASFHVFAHESGIFRIIYAEHDIHRKYSYTVNIGEKEVHGFIRPDSILILERTIPNEQGVYQRVNFYLEIDRGTETLGDFQKKLQGYDLMKEGEISSNSKFIQALYEEQTIDRGVFELNTMPEQWVKHYRVLTITSTQKRCEHLAQTTYKTFNTGEGSPRFIFTDKNRFTPIAQQIQVRSEKTGNYYKKYVLDFEKMRMLQEDIWKTGRKKDVGYTKLF